MDGGGHADGRKAVLVENGSVIWMPISLTTIRSDSKWQIRFVR